MFCNERYYFGWEPNRVFLSFDVNYIYNVDHEETVWSENTFRTTQQVQRDPSAVRQNDCAVANWTYHVITRRKDSSTEYVWKVQTSPVLIVRQTRLIVFVRICSSSVHFSQRRHVGV